MKLRLLTGLVFAFASAGAAAIPPALPGDDERLAEARKQGEQAQADLQSAEARALVDLFFARMGEGEPFDLAELFMPGAVYADDEENRPIAEEVDADGFPDISQWEPIAVFRLSDCLAASATSRLQPLGVREAVLKFHFVRDTSGALKIAWIEEVEL